jgi:rod shape-determining protein MreC
MLVITLVTASLVTITVDYKQGRTGPLAELGKAAQTIISPMQEGVTKAFHPVAQFFAALADLPSLREERDRLREQVSGLEEQQSEVTSLQFEVSELRSLIDLRQTLLSEMDTTGADVIASGVSNFEWSITIDKGSGDGIKENMPVLAASGLVGRVIEVTPTASKVALIIDPDSKVAGRLVTSRDTGLLTGRGNEDLVMNFVSNDTTVEPDEPVETAGYQGGLYPPGIPIGTVSRVTGDPADLEKAITVSPAVDFSTLDVVLVVLGPSSQ